MRIALAQINVQVADLVGIRSQILAAHEQALAGAADLLVLPELASIGYPPRDLLHRRDLIRDQWDMVTSLAGVLRLPTLLGCVALPSGPGLRGCANALALLRDGRVDAVYHKRLLPAYDVFDETRYFRPGREAVIVTVAGCRLALTICEDLWTGVYRQDDYDDDPVAEIAGRCDVVINVAASPYQAAKPAIRRQLIADVARRVRAPVVYVNQVGGYDELLFDGDSAVVSPSGGYLAVAGRWREALVIADLEQPVEPPPDIDPRDDLHAALVTGIADYCRKSGQQQVVLGLSGGIDSALVASLAVDALGPDRVSGLLMPGPYSSPGSVSDAQALAAHLGIRSWICPITEPNQVICRLLAEPFAGTTENVAEENIQARLRGLLVMAYANKFGAMALATGNKSELAVGYCTLYGDMNGGLAPIGDLYKGQVFALSGHINRHGERIPQATLDKPPSAELRPDQFDSDSLPPYPVLDRILEALIEGPATAADLIAAGEDPATVARVLRLVEISEYKRKQAAPVLRVSAKAFGTGRRIPLARHIAD